MRVVVQRVGEARVTVGGRTVAAVGPGLLVLGAAKSAEQSHEELDRSSQKDEDHESELDLPNRQDD